MYMWSLPHDKNKSRTRVVHTPCRGIIPKSAQHAALQALFVVDQEHSLGAARDANDGCDVWVLERRLPHC